MMKFFHLQIVLEIDKSPDRWIREAVFNALCFKTSHIHANNFTCWKPFCWAPLDHVSAPGSPPIGHCEICPAVQEGWLSHLSHSQGSEPLWTATPSWRYLHFPIWSPSQAVFLLADLPGSFHGLASHLLAPALNARKISKSRWTESSFAH